MNDKQVTKISLLTGGADRPYNLGMLEALVQQGIKVDFIANDDMQDAAIASNILVKYYNLRGDQRTNVHVFEKVRRVLKYYFKLIKYAFKSDSKVFHIQWYNKFIYFDRIILNLYYKALGKIIVFTAHNINERERDGNDNLINRFTLKLSYNIYDHIFVHTHMMKEQLYNEFNVEKNKVTVIKFGINSTVPNTDLTRLQARKLLRLGESQNTLLFFGNIAPYKGLEHMVLAQSCLVKKYPNLVLVIAGKMKNCNEYWNQIERLIDKHELEDNVLRKIEYIPDKEVEIYFKAADVLILPYKFIFQSGLIFLSYNFGLPVIASNVGEIKNDIIDSKTGYVFEKENYVDLAEKIEMYFNSDLYRHLERNRIKIIKHAKKFYSWENIGKTTKQIYNSFL